MALYCVVRQALRPPHHCSNSNIHKIKYLGTCHFSYHMCGTKGKPKHYKSLVLCSDIDVINGVGSSTIINSYTRRLSIQPETQPIEDMAKAILQVIDKENHPAFSRIDEGYIIEVIIALTNLQCSQSDVKTLLTIYPVILTIPMKRLNKMLLFLDQYGFRHREIIILLHQCDEILQGNFNPLTNCMNALRSLGISEKQVRTAIANDPFIRHISESNMQQRAAHLKALFKTSDVLRLIEQSPKLLYGDMNEIVYKFQYVMFQLGMEQGAIMRSTLFDHSVLHLKTRHKFLERAGLFEKPDKHGVTRIRNPSLHNIVDTDDKTFAKKIAGMPVADYLTFKKLFELEERLAEEAQRKSDEDTDDDE